MALNADALTLAQIEIIEDETGLLIEELMALAPGKTRPPTRTLRCLVWAVKNTSDPSFTMEMARAMTMDEMSDVIASTGPSAGEKRRTKKPATSDPSGAAALNA